MTFHWHIMTTQWDRLEPPTLIKDLSQAHHSLDLLWTEFAVQGDPI